MKKTETAYTEEIVMTGYAEDHTDLIVGQRVVELRSEYEKAYNRTVYWLILENGVKIEFHSISKVTEVSK